MSILSSYSASSAKGSAVPGRGGFLASRRVHIHCQDRLTSVSRLEKRIQIGEIQAGVAVEDPKIGTGIMVRHTKAPCSGVRSGSRAPSRSRCARMPSHCCQPRSDLNDARISETKSSVCSHAAKWVPLGNLL